MYNVLNTRSMGGLRCGRHWQSSDFGGGDGGEYLPFDASGKFQGIFCGVDFDIQEIRSIYDGVFGDVFPNYINIYKCEFMGYDATQETTRYRVTTLDRRQSLTTLQRYYTVDEFDIYADWVYLGLQPVFRWYLLNNGVKNANITDGLRKIYDTIEDLASGDYSDTETSINLGSGGYTRPRQQWIMSSLYYKHISTDAGGYSFMYYENGTLKQKQYVVLSDAERIKYIPIDTDSKFMVGSSFNNLASVQAIRCSKLYTPPIREITNHDYYDDYREAINIERDDIMIIVPTYYL